ncbi:helix-turn-helix domain-containing GNAT family N-acetyltransferase [Wukongibacter baidiensis]|uniref:bifunctional helix-turn-helix transcriptional regulator/GNAT family N-acetyltransferase n=1 Tax=Wukongibacter baidiensis TaxID=1723361 RepID=UPI003D7F7F8F
MKNESIILEIRSFNRFYTKILGLIDKHILDSPFTLMEARVLFEIRNIKDCTANILTDKLDVDPGHLSRILKKFESNELLYKEKSRADGRAYLLYLTERGKETLSKIVEKSNSQIQQLIGHLNKKEQEKLVNSMKYIEESLTSDISPINIRTFKSEDIEHIIERHLELYSSEYEFDDTFRVYITNGIYDFVKSHDKEREDIWVAELDGKIIGTIAVVKIENSIAELHWFLIDPDIRGRGLGKRLMKTAMEFCKEKNYRRVFLWTLNNLKAARHLYKYYGFELTETREHDLWGKHLIEERWDIEL